MLQLLKQQLLELCVHVKGARHEHVGHKANVNVKLHGGHLADEGRLLGVGAHNLLRRGRVEARAAAAAAAAAALLAATSSGRAAAQRVLLAVRVPHALLRWDATGSAAALLLHVGLWLGL